MEKTKFVIYTFGIFICYICYGIIQEKITRRRYGDKKNEDGATGELFIYAMTLVWVQCFCNWIFAKGMLLIKPQKDDTTHTGYYISCSLMYLVAMVSSNMALRWVSYPTLVIGKSAKPIPVMILGVLLTRKSYSWVKYQCVFTIVVGIVLFIYKDDQCGPVTQENNRLGEILLFLSLLLDGLIGAVQERMRSSSAPSGQQMMLAINWWTTLMLSAVIIATGEGIEFVKFASHHPEMLIHLATLALAGALGQFVIFLMVSRFGPLACSVVTTTRKFFTILCSVILFGNTLNARQWYGACLVFTALFADMINSVWDEICTKIYIFFFS